MSENQKSTYEEKGYNPPPVPKVERPVPTPPPPPKKSE